MMATDSEDARMGGIDLALRTAARAAPRRAAAAAGAIALEPTLPDARPELLPESRALLRLEPGDDHPGFLIELGAALAGDLELPIPQSFADQDSVESAARALLAALLSGARRADPGTSWFHYWTSETLRRALPRQGLDPTTSRIRREVEERITLGINLRGRQDLEFLAAQRHVDHHDASPRVGPALDALRLVLATSSFCGGDLPRALRLAIAVDGEVVSKAMTLGLLAGVYYGRKRLLEEWPGLL